MDQAKRAPARAALAYVTPGSVLGVGTGSTVAHFIEVLSTSTHRPSAAVATSCDTETRLRDVGIGIIELEELDTPLWLYVDGADEVDGGGHAIKGAGGAHAREKRVARASDAWVCIIDDSKLVDRLGSRARVPLEVEPQALAGVQAAVVSLGGRPRLRAGQLADSGNLLVDVSDLDLSDPCGMEDRLEAIPGVVACGIFAHRRVDVILAGRSDGSVATIVLGASGNTATNQHSVW